jgi:hypothetical protein
MHKQDLQLVYLEIRRVSALSIGGREAGPSSRQGWRSLSLHMDVRFLACPEFLYPAIKASYEALIQRPASD